MKQRGNTHQQGQWSLVGSLVAIAILIALAAYYIPKMLKTPTNTGAERTAIEAGQNVACSEYASQMKQAASMYRAAHDGQPATSIEQLKEQGVTDDMIHAPGCGFQISNGVVTETGQGMAPPVTLGAPPPPAAPAPTPGTTVGPGGIKIPTGSGSQSGASDAE